MFKLQKISTGEWWNKKIKRWLENEKRATIWKRKSDLSSHLNYRKDDTSENDIRVVEYQLVEVDSFPFSELIEAKHERNLEKKKENVKQMLLYREHMASYYMDQIKKILSDEEIRKILES